MSSVSVWKYRPLFKRGLCVARNKKYGKESDQVKEDAMGRACSTNVGEEECI
jgi:ubiquitin